MSSVAAPPPPPPPPSVKAEEAALASDKYADGLFYIRRHHVSNVAEAVVFSDTARGRGEHKQSAKQFANASAQRKAELAEQRLVVPLLTILRKLTSRGHMDIEVDASLVLGQLERLRHLRDEAAVLNSHTPEEIDADPLLAYRVRTLLEVVTGFGYALPPTGGKLEIEGIDEIIRFLETEYPDHVAGARASLKEDSSVTYLGLQELYHIGDTVLSELGSLGGTRVAYRVCDVYYDTQRSMFGNSKKVFHLALEFIGAVGDDFVVVSFEEVLDDWQAVRSVNALPYVPVSTAAELEPLSRRGATAAELSQGHHYRRYTAGCFFAHRAPRGTSSSAPQPSASVLASSGKIVVDAIRGLMLGYSAAPGFDSASLAFQQTSRLLGVVRRANADGETEERRRERVRSAGLRVLQQVPRELLHICWPALVGFSLNAKAWGHVLIDGLQAVEQGGNAWQSLVLPTAKKELLLALAAQKLVADARVHRVDAIEGKGSGSLFLLHGPPGVGKTLTAEALADHYGRPLYCLTFGELGSSVSELESRMNEVLQLCSAWRCVCLLDEGDALVERREKGALLLNSLVSVLLKSLDSFEGLLFLTTNRVAMFDPAALSRVTLAIRYNPLDDEARAAVWTAVLERAGAQVGQFNLSLLSSRQYSGRDINNAIRLALALAEHRDKELDQSILDEALAVADDFRAEIADPHAF